MSASTGGGSANAAGVSFPAKNLNVPLSSQFDVTGFLQTATVDAIGDPHSGGILTVDGHTIVVPKETVVILPANALTWQELFTHAPAPYTGVATGLALADVPKPKTTYEVHVVGNRVEDNSGVNGCTQPNGCDRWIAGLVNISQQDLNNGAGHISNIDYTNHEIWVGGDPNIPGSYARVKINDPSGRFGFASSPDDRFGVDADNPTISAETGFPMCLPRTAPGAGGVTTDALCPEGNRPVMAAGIDSSGITPQPNPIVAGQHYTVFRMDDPQAVAGLAGKQCRFSPCADPSMQAPFEIGDYVSFAGNLMTDATGDFISAHTITASLGIYTVPGTNPAYVSIEVSLIGTGGLTVFGAGEAAARTRFEGMSTDETRAVRLYGIDINPTTGVTTDRDWGTVLPDLGPPAGAVRGRWRFRPPCNAANMQPGKDCTGPAAGQFVPPTREVRAVIAGLQSQDPQNAPIAQTAANGIFYGQYHAPIEEYIFPENVPGTPVPENNFNSVPFLAAGGYSSSTGVRAGVLNPWPSNVLPIACAAPTFNNATFQVASGGTTQLTGAIAANALQPVTFAWSAVDAANVAVPASAFTNGTTLTPTFSAAGLAAGTYTVKLTTTGPCGTESATTSLTIAASATAPVITNITQGQKIIAGTPVTLSVSSGANTTITWSQPAPRSPAQINLPAPVETAVNGKTSAVTFTPVTAGTYTFAVKAALTATPAVSTSVTITLTVVPVDVTLTPVEYRIGKQRLVITATTSNPNPASVAIMKLQPYVTTTGAVFDPATLGANLTVALGGAAGTFTITLVGAPTPACNPGGAFATPCSAAPIKVLAYSDAAATNLIGASNPAGTALDRIRA